MKSLLWLKFYPKDWNGDHNLRACSLASRGLLASFLEPMHEAEPYGHLLLRGKKPDYNELSSVASCKLREVKYGIEELVNRGVLSITENGVLFSRRMVRDAERNSKAKSDGERGGHPKLTHQYNAPGYVYLFRRDDGAIKIGISKDPAQRIMKVRQQFPGQKLEIFDSVFVQDMGTAEAQLHAVFHKEGQYGEWFTFSDVELASLQTLIATLKGGLKPIETRDQRLETREELRAVKPEKVARAVKSSPAENVPGGVREFLTWFQSEYKVRRNGAVYFVKWEHHGKLVKDLLRAYPADRLKKHAFLLLTTDEDWTSGTDRGIGVLSTKINWLEERLCAWEVNKRAREAV